MLDLHAQKSGSLISLSGTGSCYNNHELGSYVYLAGFPNIMRCVDRVALQIGGLDDCSTLVYLITFQSETTILI